DVVQHHAPLERDRAQMRRQQRKIVRRQRRQESVEASVLTLPGKRGRAIRHRVAPASGRRRARQLSHTKFHCGRGLASTPPDKPAPAKKFHRRGSRRLIEGFGPEGRGRMGGLSWRKREWYFPLTCPPPRKGSTA